MVSWLFDLHHVVPGEVGERVGVGVGPLRQKELDFREVSVKPRPMHRANAQRQQQEVGQDTYKFGRNFGYSNNSYQWYAADPKL